MRNQAWVATPPRVTRARSAVGQPDTDESDMRDIHGKNKLPGDNHSNVRNQRQTMPDEK